MPSSEEYDKGALKQDKSAEAKAREIYPIKRLAERGTDFSGHTFSATLFSSVTNSCPAPDAFSSPLASSVRRSVPDLRSGRDDAEARLSNERACRCDRIHPSCSVHNRHLYRWFDDAVDCGR